MYPSELFNTKNLVDKIETRGGGGGGGAAAFVRHQCVFVRTVVGQRTKERMLRRSGWVRDRE